VHSRDNTDGQLLNRSEPHLIESTTYNPSNPIKVIVHGWLGTTQEKDSLCMCNVNCKLVIFLNYLLSIESYKNIISNYLQCIPIGSK